MIPNAAMARSQTSLLRGFGTLMRPRQWAKNAFVFAPLLFSGEFTDAEAIGRSCVAALLFCLVSSFSYVVNDLCDIERDRRHPTKAKTRPLASGLLTVRQGISLMVVLGAIILVSWLLLPHLAIPTGLYLVLGVSYSTVLKHQPVLDIFAIAAGFVLRVYAGAIALAVPLSEWMFVTTLSMALFLAAIKRRQELMQRGTNARDVLQTYTLTLTDRFAEMSAIGTMLFYGLYVTSTRPQLVATVPIVLFGLFRYWYIVDVLGKGESPTDVIFEDRQLALAGLIWAGACVWLLWP